MIPISLSEKFCCQNLITSIKVINMTRNSSKSNKLRNINTIGCRTKSSLSALYSFPSNDSGKLVTRLYDMREGLVDRTLVQAPSNFIAGRPKVALLFWFFGDSRCGVPLFIIILVIYKYENR